MTGPVKRLVIAAGGTGGHMFPAQALAETMLARGWAVTLSTDARGARYAGGFPAEVTRETVSSATPARGGRLAKLAVPLRVGGGAGASLARMVTRRPAAVIGFGGYPSIPALAAATALRIPRLIHEQNGVLGRVNQAFLRRVTAIACGTWPTEGLGAAPAEHVGNPVRAAVRARAGAPYVAPGDAPVHVLVIGGSQGARILSDVVPGAVAALPPDLRSRIRLSQQVRDEDRARVEAFYAAEGIAADLAPFFADLPERMADAQIVIARSGASTVADLTVIGRPSILIPYAAAAADHQTANARALVAAGAARLAPEAGLSAESLSAAMSDILTDPARATAMADAARGLGRPDAAERLADLVERVAGGAAAPAAA